MHQNSTHTHTHTACIQHVTTYIAFTGYIADDPLTYPNDIHTILASESVQKSGQIVCQVLDV